LFNHGRVGGLPARIVVCHRVVDGRFRAHALVSTSYSWILSFVLWQQDPRSRCYRVSEMMMKPSSQTREDLARLFPGSFGPIHRPRVLWAGVGKGAEEMAALQGWIDWDWHRWSEAPDSCCRNIFIPIDP
jgi:hypothetical protein